MFHWKTKDVVADIQKIEGVSETRTTPPGGDIDSQNIVVYVGEELLYVCAFCYADYNVNPEEYDFDAVELADQTGDGLNSTDETVALVYVRIRKYFEDRDIVVVRNIEDYF